MYFGFVMGNYGISFWLPQIVKDTITKDSFHIGILTAIPWAAGAIAMVIVGPSLGRNRRAALAHCDNWNDRRRGICRLGDSGNFRRAGPGVPTSRHAGLACAFSTFWSLPTSILSGAAASAGIAWINSVGNLAGYFSPYLVGKIRDTTHNMTIALLMLSFFCLLSAIVTITAFKPVRDRLRSAVNV